MVKRSENGVITNPFWLAPGHTLGEANALMAKYHISGVPICDKGKLIGIITNRDLKFETDMDRLIDDVMTKENLVTAKEGTTLDEAKEILRQRKVEKLPIVDDEMHLKGLITIKDIEKAVAYPNAARDEGGRLLCGAAIGVTADLLDRVAALVEVGADVLVSGLRSRSCRRASSRLSAASRRSIPTCSSSPATWPPRKPPKPSSRQALTA